MKRICICCDGTWNRIDGADPTNVVGIATSIAPTGEDDIKQLVYYEEGVGSGRVAVASRLDRWLGGGFGWGLLENVRKAYQFLVFNYEPGDEIFIFGFSRGAYTARSLAGLIRNCGIVERPQSSRIEEAITLYRQRGADAKPKSEASFQFRASAAPDAYVGESDRLWREERGLMRANARLLRIDYIGVWDTVGALGVPQNLWFSRWLNRRYEFHDAELSSCVARARHAVAIDEARKAFSPSLWTNMARLNAEAARNGDEVPYEQLWFPGDHGSVGGGGDVRGLSNAGMIWIAEGALAAGLHFRPGILDQYRCQIDYRAALRNRSNPSPSPMGRLMALLPQQPRKGPQSVDDVSEWARRRWAEAAERLPGGEAYRPRPLAHLEKALGAAAIPPAAPPCAEIEAMAAE